MIDRTERTYRPTPPRVITGRDRDVGLDRADQDLNRAREALVVALAAVEAGGTADDAVRARFALDRVRVATSRAAAAAGRRGEPSGHLWAALKELTRTTRRTLGAHPAA